MHERYLIGAVPPSSPPINYKMKNKLEWVLLWIEGGIRGPVTTSKGFTYISTESEDDEADDAGDEEEHYGEGQVAWRSDVLLIIVGGIDS